MIEMWDGLFSRLAPDVKGMLARGEVDRAYPAMALVLDEVWNAADGCMKEAGMVCVNIGDATRTSGGLFRVYPNHTVVGASFLALGYSALPEIIWRKTSNKPNKFMGSGMLPPGAYVTQEHEYVMTYRKGRRRRFVGVRERAKRSRSAYFWEERNAWFSDNWQGLQGERQNMERGGPRPRSAAFPFELAHRLICMYSLQDDLVLDPFLGTGVTTFAAMVAGRNSLGIELDPNFRDAIDSRIEGIVDYGNRYNGERLDRHRRLASGNPRMKYSNDAYGFPVMTRQETKLELPVLSSVRRTDKQTFEVEYSRGPRTA